MTNPFANYHAKTCRGCGIEMPMLSDGTYQDESNRGYCGVCTSKMIANAIQWSSGFNAGLKASFDATTQAEHRGWVNSTNYGIDGSCIQKLVRFVRGK